MAYLDPTMNLPLTTPAWLLGANPSLAWSAPSGTPDHVVVYRGATNDWSLSTPIATLAGNALSYTDTTALRDGTLYYWWVIAFADAAGLFAGSNRGVAGWQDTFIEPLVDGTSEAIKPCPVAAIVNGEFRSHGSVAFTSCLCRDGYAFPTGQPNAPFPDYVSFTIVQGPMVSPLNSIAGPFTGALYAFVPWAGLAGVGLPGGGGAANPATSPANVAHVDPVIIDANNSTPQFIFITPDISGVFAPAPNSGGVNFGALGGGIMTANISYVSPAAGTVAGGQAPAGGGFGTPPGARIINPPMPVPLPCIPCCMTAAPICHCTPAAPGNYG